MVRCQPLVYPHGLLALVVTPLLIEPDAIVCLSFALGHHKTLVWRPRLVTVIFYLNHFQVPDELLQEAKAAAKAALEEMDAD